MVRRGEGRLLLSTWPSDGEAQLLLAHAMASHRICLVDGMPYGGTPFEIKRYQGMLAVLDALPDKSPTVDWDA